MKKFSKILLFMLILPLCFSFSACKKKSGNDTPNNPSTEQPGTNPDGGTGDDEGGDVATAKYTISFDYNLPADYDFLLTDNQIQENVGTTKSLENIIQDQKLLDCFDYWSEVGSSEPITSVTSDAEKTISLIGNWKIDDLKNYYYSDGLTFSVQGNNAFIDGYTGTSNKIIIPKYYKHNGVDKTVYGFVLDEKNDKGVFEGKTVEKLIINTSSISIGERTFKNSTLPSDFNFSIISHLGVSSFENSNVKNVVLSSKLESVSESAFANCALLESIDLGGFDDNIASKMFYNCSNLVAITGANNIADVESYAFANCSKISNIDFFGDKLTHISSYAFANCTELVSLSLPKNINYLGESSFTGCNKLSEISIGRLYQLNGTSSTNLAYYLGSDVAANIKKISIIGDLSLTIPRNYFKGFTNLETFDMGNCVSEVVDEAFKDCVNLKNITISPKIKEGKITYKAFSNTKFLTERTTPILIEGDTVILYVPDSIEGEYTIPSTITKINESAFYNKVKLTKITIPSSVTTIGKSAFDSCTGLKEVVFEENTSLQAIGYNTFYSCTKLESINLTNLKNLTTIGENAFIGAKIDEIKLPASLTSIGLKAFFNAGASKFVVEEGNTKYAAIDGVLYEINDKKEPVKLVDYPMKKQALIFECPSTVTEIKGYTFSYLQSLQAVYFPQNSVVWGESVFFGNNYSVNIYSPTTEFSLPIGANARMFYRADEGKVIYDASAKTITLAEGFVKVSDYMYIQYNYDVGGTTKIDIVSFKVTSTYDSENKKYTYSVVDGTIQRFETTLTK